MVLQSNAINNKVDITTQIISTNKISTTIMKEAIEQGCIKTSTKGGLRYDVWKGLILHVN